MSARSNKGKSKPAAVDGFATADVPTFNDDALSNLTAKIEQGLKKSKEPSSGKKNGKQNEKKDKGRNGSRQKKDLNNIKGKKRTIDGQVKQSGLREGNEKGHVHAGITSGGPGPSGKENRVLNGQPRDSVQEDAKRKPRPENRKKTGGFRRLDIPVGANGTDSNKRIVKKNGVRLPRSQEEIESEVLALGGTEEDLALFAGQESDSEVEGKEFGGKGGVVQDLKSFVKVLGFSKVRQCDADAELDEEDDCGDIPDESRNPSRLPAKQRTLPNREIAISQAGSKKSPDTLHFEPRAEWHNAPLPMLPESSEKPANIHRETIERLHEHAKKLLEAENNGYATQNNSRSSSSQFYSAIMSSGTLSDKISALTLSIQESPLHNVKALENLVALAKKRSRDQAVDSLGALKDLLGPGSLLPSNRKLRTFASQPGLFAVPKRSLENWAADSELPKPLKEIHLVSWAFEDWLKSLYFDILKIIETWCNDGVIFARGKAVDYVFELLKDKPEQEANLLRLLVNKLGDSEKKIASKTSYNTLQLENTHPLMKLTIIAAIESDLLFKPGQSLHAKYYAMITLNQTVLSGKEEGVARKLLDIYFSLFVGLLSPKETANPIVSAGNSVTVNRKGETQGGGSAPGKKAQKKLASKESGNAAEEASREKMLSAVLTGVNRAIPYLSVNDEIFEKYLDTLFRVTHSSNFNTSIQALILIEQICRSHPASADRFYRTLYESLLDPRLLTSPKQAMYLNLLFRALRSDLKIKRVKAFAKRLLQVVAMHQASFICGVLYLLRELEGAFASLPAFVDQPEENDSDEEEVFRDVDEDTDVGEPPQTNAAPAVGENGLRRKMPQVYDGRKRDPEYSNAEQSCLWELTPFLKHFHPSVSLFASRLLTHEVMPAKPDLSMHTLIRFLDRFVYRNPKAVSAPRGASIMQPMAGNENRDLLVSAHSLKRSSRDPVNSDSFRNLDSAKVDADEVFFHKYFSKIGSGKDQARKKKQKKKVETEANSESDEGAEMEDEIWQALVDSRPELEGSEESDGLGMEDLESTMGNSDGESASGGVQYHSGEESTDGDGAEDLDLGDDDEAMLDSEDEVPNDIDEMFQKEMQQGQERADEVPRSGTRSKKRRKLKNLPMFAEAEDYATLLNGDDDVNI